jgi:excisionase family DNA binding protein
MDKPQQVTVREAAARLGLSERRITQLAEKGELAGKKPGKLWLLDRDSVERVRRDRLRQIESPRTLREFRDALVETSIQLGREQMRAHMLEQENERLKGEIRRLKGVQGDD